MARTTGYTATVALRLPAKGLYKEKGVCPPEYIGRHKKCVDFMLEELAQRGILYREKTEQIN